MKRLILASGSPRRRALLELVQIPFEVITSKTDETIEPLPPQETVMKLARRKAMAVWERIETEDIVLGSDTIVSLDGKILGKPADEEEASRMLRLLAGRTHEVYTGVALLTRQNGELREKVFYEKAQVEMYPMSEEEIRSYIATGEPMDKAGAYGIQGRAAIYIKGIAGDYHTVVGLPVARVYQELKDWGAFEE